MGLLVLAQTPPRVTDTQATTELPAQPALGTPTAALSTCHPRLYVPQGLCTAR